MKTVKVRRMMWTVPALATLLVGSATQFGVVRAEDAKPEKPAKVVRPKSKTVDGTISASDATQVKLTTKAGDVTSNLATATEFYRINMDVASGELKTGDVLRFPLRGTSGLPTVQSLAPLTLNFDGKATLTFTDAAKMKFDRVTKIAATDLAVGQQAKVANNLYDDGKLEAREVWVSIPAPKPVKP